MQGRIFTDIKCNLLKLSLNCFYGRREEPISRGGANTFVLMKQIDVFTPPEINPGLRAHSQHGTPGSNAAHILHNLLGWLVVVVFKAGFMGK